MPALPLVRDAAGSATGHRSLRAAAWRRFRRNHLALGGATAVAVLVIAAACAPYLAPFDPAHQALAEKLSGPGARHWLGTDEFGRDVLSRLIYGSRVELIVGFAAVLMGLTLGVVLGTASAYWGGVMDEITMRVLDVLLAFPYLLLAILAVSVLGANLRSTILAVGLWATPGFARVIRGLVLRTIVQEYVEASRAIGARTIRIIFRHILPNCISVMVVYSALYMASAILLEAGLSFLGLGVQPPTPSWGIMVSTGRTYLLEAPHIATFAGLAIAVTVLGFNLVADGLRDIWDTKLTL